MSETLIVTLDEREIRRDLALEAALQARLWVHLTFRAQPGVRIEQGWVHLHAGHLVTCTSRDQRDCAEHRRKIAEMLHDGEIRPLIPVDMEALIRIDATVTESGHYVALWHDPEADERHTLSEWSQRCCRAPWA
jgi:hypothetical protein